MNILALNPWIYDFAAYDFWLKPYGFLTLLSYLNQNPSIKIDYIDCLEKKISQANFGRGKYYSEIIEKPAVFKKIPRYFKRYGLTLEEFQNQLKDKKYDYILITSSMTYWYPAITDLVKIIRQRYPQAKIILGGTYATLCQSHAKKNTGCDYIIKNGRFSDFFKLLKIKFNPHEFYFTLPAYEDFYSRIDYAVFRTSWGCPFNCSYCAIKKLFPAPMIRINADKIAEYIKKYSEQGIKDFVLYDDAFLYGPDYAKNLLTKLLNLKIDTRFHTPNALHLKFLDTGIAFLLKKTGFINPHFGLETLKPSLQKSWGDKVTLHDLKKGISLLKEGGFKNGEFSMYLLLGYPRQRLNNIKKEAQILHALGANVSLAEFSPVPQTKLFKTCKKKFNEPLLHNNSIFGSFQKKKINEFWEIKNYVRKLNKSHHSCHDLR